MKMARICIPCLAAATLGCVLLVDACSLLHCDSCTSLEVRMPNLDSQVPQTVSVNLQQVGGTSAPISCTWAPLAPSGTYGWTCTKDSAGQTTRPDSPSFYYDISDGQKSWTIQITGPSGSSTVTRAPKDIETGEAASLTDCSCFSYSLELTADDMKSVGAVLPNSIALPDAGAEAGSEAAASLDQDASFP